MSTYLHKIISRFDLKELWDSFTERDRQRVEATLFHTPVDVESVLDVGCGDGRFLKLLASKYSRAIGIDYCFEPISRIQTPCLQASATHLPFQSASFDLIVATEMLEHLPPD